jgi:hypothetical protein
MSSRAKRSPEPRSEILDLFRRDAVSVAEDLAVNPTDLVTERLEIAVKDGLSSEPQSGHNPSPTRAADLGKSLRGTLTAQLIIANAGRARLGIASAA